jgi:hypothetical protein
MATLPTNAEMTGSGVTEGGFKGKLNDFLTFIRDTLGTNGTVSAVRTALGLGAMALKNDVAEADLATGAVTAGKIGTDAVVTAKIQDGAVTSGKLGASAVISGKIAANAVQTGNVSDGALTTAKLADGAVTAVKIADGVVGTAKLADGSVTVAKTSGLPISLEFVSTDQTVTLAGALTLTHGLGVTPKFVTLDLICQTAELGYSVGEVAQYGIFGFDTIPSVVISIRRNTTQILVRYPAGGMGLGRADTGVLASITPANWLLRVRAFA